ncbi:restriction endonuclease [Pirellulaceae bacterium]|nr:restriction endonuclease [Pirellulaceae bacterium]
MNQNTKLTQLRAAFEIEKAAKDAAELNLANAIAKRHEWKRLQLIIRFRLLLLIGAKWVKENGFSNGTLIVLGSVITFAVVGLPIWFSLKSPTFASLAFGSIVAFGIVILCMIRRPQYSNPPKSIAEVMASVAEMTERVDMHIKGLECIAESQRQKYEQIELEIIAIVNSEQYKEDNRVKKEKERVEKENQRKQRQIDVLKNTNWRELRGVPWENFLQHALENHGIDVETTATSGDHGIDLIAKTGSKSIAIQAKGYSGSVGNAAVQQAFTGMAIYRCTHCAVITNSEFTSSAKHAAERTGCILVGGSEMLDLIVGDMDVFLG